MIQSNDDSSNQYFPKYLTLDDLKEKLNELKNLDLSKSNIEEISSVVSSYIEVIPSVFGNYSIEKFNNFSFYRVRLNVKENEDLQLLRTFSYPLPQFCTENGRANLKNKSVFYSTNCALTAIMESKPKVGDIGYLSVWEGCTTRVMKAGILLPKDLKRENIWSAMANDIYTHAKKNSNEKTQEIFKFISQLFLYEESPYCLTSFISNELMYGENWNDFVVYPSFVNDGFSCNLAIHPNVVDNFLRFKKVIRFKVLKISNGEFSVSTGRVGEISNTNINWRSGTKEERDFSLFPLAKV